MCMHECRLKLQVARIAIDLPQEQPCQFSLYTNTMCMCMQEFTYACMLLPCLCDSHVSFRHIHTVCICTYIFLHTPTCIDVCIYIYSHTHTTHIYTHTYKQSNTWSHSQFIWNPPGRRAFGKWYLILYSCVCVNMYACICMYARMRNR
jgi:hypothetical protein